MRFLFTFTITKVSFQTKRISLEIGIIYICSFLVLCLVYFLKNSCIMFLKNTHWDFFFFSNDPWHFSFECLWDILVLTARNEPRRTPQSQASAAEWKSARGPVLGSNLFREETANCCCQFTYLYFAVRHRTQNCVCESCIICIFISV